MSSLDDIVSAAPAPAGKKPANEPYDDIVAAAPPPADYKPAVMVGMSKDPIAAARYKEVGTALGVPPSLVEANPEAFDRRYQEQKTDEALVGAPATQGWLSQSVDNAAIAKGDAGQLTGVERAMHNLYHASAGVLDTAKAVGYGALSAVYTPVEAVVNAPLALVRKGVSAVQGTEYKPPQSTVESLFDQPLARLTRSAKAEQEQIQTSGTVESSIYGAVSSIEQSLPTMLLAVGVSRGNPAAAAKLSAIIAGMFQGFPKYGEALTSGKSYAESLRYGITQGGLEAATELAPGLKLLEDIKVGTPVFKTVWGYIAKEVPNELVASYTQAFDDWVTMNPNKTASEFISELPELTAQTVLTTLLAGGAQGALMSGGAKLLARREKGRQDRESAQSYADGIQRVTEAVQQTATHTRSPETMREYLDHLAPDEKVHIDAKDFNQVLFQKGIDPADFAQKLPSIKDTYQDASELDGVLSIPVGEYIAAIGTGETGSDMLQHIRKTPEDMSMAESQIAPEGAQQMVEDIVASTLAQVATEAPIREATVAFEKQLETAKEAKAATADVTAELTRQAQEATPHLTKAQNRQSAALTAAWYTELAKRLRDTGKPEYANMNAKTLMDMHGAAIVPTENVTPSGTRLSQAEQMDWSFLTAELDAGKELSTADAKKYARLAELQNIYGGIAGYGDYQKAAVGWRTTQEAKGFEGQTYSVPETPAAQSILKKSRSLEKEIFNRKTGLKPIASFSPEEKLSWKYEVTQPLGFMKDGYTVEFRYNDIGTQKTLTAEGYAAQTAPIEATMTFTAPGESEPSLRVTVTEQGELTIHGPEEKSALFKKLEAAGDAELARGKDGVTPEYADGTHWTRLTGAGGTQLMSVLARTHAMLRGTQESEHMGLFWTRATGATGTSAESEVGLLGRSGTIYMQQQQAYYEPASATKAAVIGMSKAANVSSYVHEGAHHFLELMSHFAGQQAAPQTIKDDFTTALTWMGVKDKAAWDSMSLEEKRPFHEKFATGWETYMFEGKAPSLSLRQMFRDFSKWMKSIYIAQVNLQTPLDAEIRGVFDRMIASDKAIEQMGASRNIAAIAGDETTTSPVERAAAKAALEATIGEAQDTLIPRALRDMRWLSNAKSAVLKELQAKEQGIREVITAEEKSKMDAEPVWQAVAAMKKPGQKMDAGLVAHMRLLESEKRAIAPYTAKTNGIHPDILAAEHGYLAGQELISAIANAGDYDTELRARIDTRMMQEHSEFNTPQSVARMADEALHNEALLRFLATGYQQLTKTDVPVRVMVAGIKQAAQAKLAVMKVADISPATFAAAEARAAKAVEKAVRSKDIEGAKRARMSQMVNAALAKEAYAFVAERDAGLASVKEFLRKPEANISKRYDTGLVNAMRVVASEYGIKPAPPGKVALDFLGQMKDYEPAKYEELRLLLRDASDVANKINGDYTQATAESFRGVMELLDVLKAKARTAQEVVIEGKTVDRKELQTKLAEELSHITPTFDLSEVGKLRAKTKLDEHKADFMSVDAASRGMEGWIQSLGLQFNSAWGQVYRTVRTATTAMRADEALYLNRYKDILAKAGNDLNTPFPTAVVATEFGTPRVFKNKAELMGFLMHMGNESNTRKNLVGRGFATVREVNGQEIVDTKPAWEFLNRMIAEGKLDKRHFDAMQETWDLMDQLKPLAQASHMHQEGYYFKEVEAAPFVVAFGDQSVTYRGGYVPAMVDKFADAARATLQETQLDALQESINVLMPTTPKGATKSRVNVDYPLEMDVGILGRHISNVLRYSHLGPAIYDVQRVLKGKSVQQQLTDSDPAAYNSLIVPFLNRAAKQTVSLVGRTPSERTGDRWYQKLRMNTTIGLMFANIPNTAQQITGMSLGSVLTSPSGIVRGIANDVLHRESARQFISAKSVFMRTAFEHSAGEAREHINALLYDEGLVANAEEWSKRHAFYLQTVAQNFVNSAVWQAAYNDAVANKGEAAKNNVDSLNDDECVQWADSVIRRTQGTTSPEDLMHWAEGGTFHMLFKMFHNYFDMNRELIRSEGSRALRTEGKSGVAKRWGYIYVTGFMVNALAADLVIKALQQNFADFDDEDGDGYLDDWLDWFFMTQAKFGLAMGSVAGQAIMAAVNSFNGEVSGDRMSLSPVGGLIGSAAHLGKDVATYADTGEMPTRSVTDVLSLGQVFTPIPLMAVNRPYKYLTGVESGKFEEPTGPIDVALGLASGKGVKE